MRSRAFSSVLRQRGAFFVFAFATTLGAEHAASAADDRAAAEALFTKGRDAAKRGDMDAACAAFEESVKLDPAPGTMFNLGDCEEKRRHRAAAWQCYEETLSKLAATDDRRKAVEKRIAALEAHLPTLSIRLAPDSPKETVVERDGHELGAASLGVALPLDDGAHRVVVSAPGHDSRRFDVELAEGQHEELVVEPGAVTAPVAAPAPESPPAIPAAEPPRRAPVTATKSPGDSTRFVGYAIGGAGVASVVTALVLGGVALGEKSTVDSHCNRTTRVCDSQSGLDAASTGSALTTASTVTFVVGAAAIGVGAYFILTSGKSTETALRASAGPGTARLSLSHTF